MTLHPRRLCHLLGLVSSDPAPVGVLGLVTQISPEDREENMDGSVTFRLLSDGPSFTCFPARLNEPPPHQVQPRLSTVQAPCLGHMRAHPSQGALGNHRWPRHTYRVHALCPAQACTCFCFPQVGHSQLHIILISVRKHTWE